VSEWGSGKRGCRGHTDPTCVALQSVAPLIVGSRPTRTTTKVRVALYTTFNPERHCMLFPVRKIVSLVEEIRFEHGPVPALPLLKGAIAAVVGNPYVGQYVDDLSPATAELRELGEELGGQLITRLGGDPSSIESYGKGAIVGAAGEIEHGAMWHIPGGGGMRAAIGRGTSIVPSTKKVGAMGARLDVPLTHLDWSYVGSHYDAIEMGVSDGPRPDEMVLILAMATGGRINARLAGGFTLDDQGKPGMPA
jgi:hypothetical protein